MSTTVVEKDLERDDWNGGPDSWYYPGDAKQNYLIDQLLMFGVDGPASLDIPTGFVYGIDANENRGSLAVGYKSMDRAPKHQ